MLHYWAGSIFSVRFHIFPRSGWKDDDITLAQAPQAEAKGKVRISSPFFLHFRSKVDFEEKSGQQSSFAAWLRFVRAHMQHLAGGQKVFLIMSNNKCF